MVKAERHELLPIGAEGYFLRLSCRITIIIVIIILLIMIIMIIISAFIIIMIIMIITTNNIHNTKCINSNKHNIMNDT